MKKALVAIDDVAFIQPSLIVRPNPKQMAVWRPNIWVQRVRRFQEKRMLHTLPLRPVVPSSKMRADLIGLTYEEARELQKALVEGDLERTIDACADLITIVIGVALHHGVDITPHMEEVAIANMEKKPADGKGFGRMTKYGKSTKDGWNKPRIKEILEAQGVAKL